MSKEASLKDKITFARLSEIDLTEIVAHMSDPRVRANANSIVGSVAPLETVAPS